MVLCIWWWSPHCYFSVLLFIYICRKKAILNAITYSGRDSVANGDKIIHFSTSLSRRFSSSSFDSSIILLLERTNGRAIYSFLLGFPSVFYLVHFLRYFDVVDSIRNTEIQRICHFNHYTKHAKKQVFIKTHLSSKYTEALDLFFRSDIKFTFVHVEYVCVSEK